MALEAWAAQVDTEAEVDMEPEPDMEEQEDMDVDNMDTVHKKTNS